ncbi:MAG: pyridoxamine 5'-phosphate oxidase [Bacteroidota bacterium]|nr:pyridoxamine 5'-phosphate oxidase [Bacteroidota bacterium]
MSADSEMHNFRKDYRLQSLLEKDVIRNPIHQFEKWWTQALESNIIESNAMTLATCNAEGKPSARIVLLKGIRDNGFLFFTNYDSRKGKEMGKNKFVSLVFFWKELERQVRIEGVVEKISPKESDAYFAKRPRESRIGAWSSPQSSVIANREILEQNASHYNKQFDTENIPRPENWGGYIVHPNVIEFWQGRPGRLHDRLQYSIDEKEIWKIERLAP